MDSASASGAQRQDEGLRERLRPSQPVDANAVDQALATAGYGVTTDSRTSDDKKTFGRTPDGISKFSFSVIKCRRTLQLRRSLPAIAMDDVCPYAHMFFLQSLPCPRPMIWSHNCSLQPSPRMCPTSSSWQSLPLIYLYSGPLPQRLEFPSSRRFICSGGPHTTAESDGFSTINHITTPW